MLGHFCFSMPVNSPPILIDEAAPCLMLLLSYPKISGFEKCKHLNKNTKPATLFLSYLLSVSILILHLYCGFHNLDAAL